MINLPKRVLLNDMTVRWNGPMLADNPVAGSQQQPPGQRRVPEGFASDGAGQSRRQRSGGEFQLMVNAQSASLPMLGRVTMAYLKP